MSRYTDKLNKKIKAHGEYLQESLDEHLNTLNKNLNDFDWGLLNYHCLLAVLEEKGFEVPKNRHGNEDYAVRKSDGKIVRLPNCSLINNPHSGGDSPAQEIKEEKKKTKKKKAAYIISLLTFLGGLILVVNEIGLFPAPLGLALDATVAFFGKTIFIGVGLVIVLIIVLFLDIDAPDGIDPTGVIQVSKIALQLGQLGVRAFESIKGDIDGVNRQYDEIITDMDNKYEELKVYYGKKFYEIIKNQKDAFIKEYRNQLDRL